MGAVAIASGTIRQIYVTTSKTADVSRRNWTTMQKLYGRDLTEVRGHQVVGMGWCQIRVMRTTRRGLGVMLEDMRLREHGHGVYE
jgi:hypothetical protein